MPQIDPKLTFYFGVWTSVLLLVASGTINFTGALPDLWVPIVTKWCGILGAINSTILTAASGYSSNKTGPMVSVPATVIKVLIVAFALSFLIGIPSAQAQVKLHAPAVTGDLNKDIKTDLGIGSSNSPSSPLSLLPGQTSLLSPDQLIKKIIALSAPDLTYAAAMATAANTNAATVRLGCIKAIQQLNQQASGSTLKNADGTPMTPPAEPKIFTDLETIAEGIDSLSPTGPLYTSCAGAAALAQTNVLAFINAVVTGTAGAALVVPK